MLNPLKIATDGYLKRTAKAVLVIAVSGYLSFGGTPPVNENLADGYRRSHISEHIIDNKKKSRTIKRR